MHRIDSDASVNGLFSAGNPASGQPGTVVSPEWLNAIQEEIAGLIEAMGGTLAKANNAQLAAVILGLFARLNTWTAKQTFAGGLDVLGQGIIGLNGGAGAGIEVAGTNVTLIDFKNDASHDFDARIVKFAGAHLTVEGTPLSVPEPEVPGDAATKGYVDSVAPALVCRVDGIETDRPMDGNGHRQPSMLRGSMNGGRIIGSNGSYTFYRPGITVNAIITATVCGTDQNGSPVSMGVSNLRPDYFDIIQYSIATDGSAILRVYDMAIVVWSW